MCDVTDGVCVCVCLCARMRMLEWGGGMCVGMYISACYVQIYLCTLQFAFS